MSDMVEDYIPRNYQMELMRVALKQNTVLYLPTGAGKTYIAVLVLKQLSQPILRPWPEGGKISIILVNTVALVHQHAEYLRRHTNFKIGSYSGDMSPDVWNSEVWDRECREHQVMIMTSQILTDAVEKSFLSLERINLLIFDECHRGVHDHTMRQLMRNFQHIKKSPRILGLTATLLNGNCKSSQVQSQVFALETTYHSKVATVDDLSIVMGYSTNPREKIVSYMTHKTSHIEETVLQTLRKLKETLRTIQLNDSPKKTNLLPLETKSDLKNIVNLIEDVIYHVTELGTFGGIKAIVAHTIQVERLKKYCENMKMYSILNSVVTEFTFVKRVLERQLTGDIKIDIFKYSSPKVNELFNIIQNYKEQCDEELCAIIFVQRRFTAKVLYHILKCLGETFTEYSFVKSNYMVGYTVNPTNNTREGLYFNKMNMEIIQKFYLKEVNLICSSSVLEEGIDVPKCSMVIKFDAPLDYRAYVQSKGRARHKNSLYYMMVEEGETNGKFQNRYESFKQIEEQLNEFLVGQNEFRQAPSQQALTDLYEEHSVSPYYVDGPGSAQVNMVSACSLLSQYCNTLPSDGYTSYAPIWYVEENNLTGSCRVVIDMPMICPIIDSIKGPYMNTKKEAKRAAALMACVMLHEKGELDDDLVPTKRLEIVESTEHLFSHWPVMVKEKDAGNKKTRRIHPILIPTACKGQISQNSVRLHLINLNPKFDNNKLKGSWSFMNDMYTSLLCFGIISRNKIPRLCEFPIYVSAGEISVNVQVNVRTIELTTNEFKEIQEFNHLIYRDVLGILREYLVFNNEEDAEMLMVVPVQKDECCIDFTVMRENKNLVNKCLEPSSEEKMRINVQNDEYRGKIVTPWYRPDETEYLVIDVCKDMDAYSCFPSGSHESYFEYFKSMYQITVLSPHQPLLRVKALSSRLNCLKPRAMGGKRNKDMVYEDYEIHFVAEMVVKQNFPAQLWVQAKLLPSIFDKILQLLRANELRQKIAIEADLGAATLSHDWQPLQLDVHLLNREFEYKSKNEEPHEGDETVECLKMTEVSSILNKLNADMAAKKLNAQFPWDKSEEPVDIERNLNVTLMDVQYYENFLSKSVQTHERNVQRNLRQIGVPAITYHKSFVQKNLAMLETSCRSGPELAEVYEALATAKSGDIVNLERLETLGDSFLKWISSLYIILKYPKADEGKATILKGKIVSNKNLYYVAVKKRLEVYLKLSDLKPKSEWSPPCYGLPRILRQLTERDRISNSSLLNLEIPREEQINGKLSYNTEQSILAEVTNNEVQSHETNSVLTYYAGQQSVSDKVIADIVESLLGAYLQSCGIQGGIKLVEWLEIIPKTENLMRLLQSSPPDPLLNPKSTQADIDFHISSYEDMEKRLGYKFNNRAYLLQAVTHSSYTVNRVTACYQRLEFLGDAILDFLITCHIYESCGYLKPGDLTDLRSALVNNVTFACYTVRCGFHKFLLCISSKLQGHIDKFLIFQENKDFAINDDVLILLNENDMHIAENIDVPKVLGDVFEALAGAIFLDSGMSLKTVWNVFYKIMWKEIDMFSNNTPKNAVRVLHEKVGAHPVFHKVVTLDNGKVMVKLDFMIDGTVTRVHGFGDNKSEAKKAAAKMALRLLNRE